MNPSPNPPTCAAILTIPGNTMLSFLPLTPFFCPFRFTLEKRPEKSLPKQTRGQLGGIGTFPTAAEAAKAVA